jgi:hypothetical protein
MSDSIYTGSFLHHVDLSHRASLAAAMRPPLYPLLLGLAHRIPGMSSDEALVLLHLLIGGCILALTPWLLRKLLPPPLCACATGIALLSAKQVAYGEMSEWLAMSLVFACFVSYVLWRMRPTCAGCARTIALLSLSILTRSALMPLLCLAPCMVLQSNMGRRLSTVGGVMIGLLPLAAWATVHLARLDSWSLGNYEGLNLLATARSLGTIPSSPHDPTETTAFITYLNTHGVTPSLKGFAPRTVHAWDGEFYDAFHANFDTVGDAVILHGATMPVRAGNLAARSISAHRDNYRSFLAGGWYTFSRSYAPLIVLCLITTVWLSRRDPSVKVWSSTALTLCALSLAYLASVFCTVLWLHRYIVPIQPVLLFCTVVSTARLLATFREKNAPTATLESRSDSAA